jgi:hypothetical protein
MAKWQWSVVLFEHRARVRSGQGVMKSFSKTFDEWVTMPEKRQSDPLWHVAIFIAAVVLAVCAGRGHWGLSSLSFSYANQVLLFSSLQGLSAYLHWPPGYAILAIPLHFLGINPIQSLWLLSVLAFALVNVLVFVITSRFANRSSALLATALSLLHPVLLLWSNQVMTEMVFTAAMLWAIFRVLLTIPDDQPAWKNVVTGLALAAPCWFRYIGVMVTVSGLVVLALWGVPQRKKKFIAVLLYTALFCVPVFVRNLIFKSTIVGHGLGNKPRADFLTAFSDTCYEMAKAWFPLPQSWQSLPSLHGIGILLLLVAILFLILNRHSLSRLLPAGFPLLYVIGFAFAYSHARIDPLNERFVMPMVALLNIGGVLSWDHWHEWAGKRFRKTASTVSVALAGVVLYFCLKGGMAVANGAMLSNNVLASETIAYILKNVPPGSSIAANRNQLSAYSLQYMHVTIPSNRPEDVDYQQVFRAVWTRRTALRSWLDRDVRYVAFFLGEDQWDPMLAASAYGPYVDSLRTLALPEIGKKYEFRDGVFLQLARPDTLQKLLAK